jgi:DHA1 family bicyclomycin/chloramphenicol resistance-like MFS transporter
MLLGYILVLAAAGSLMPFTIDPFLPSFPAIAETFGVPNGTLQFTLTGVTLGFALGQLFAGPLSDAFGRRTPMLIAMGLYVVSAVLLFFAPTIEIFFLLRVTMAAGAAASNVIGQAIIRDLFSGMSMMKMLGRVYTIQSLSPVVGPIVGAQLVGFIAWQQVFLVFALTVLISLLLAHRVLVETLPVARRRSHTPAGLMRGYRSVLRDRVYVGLLIFGGMQVSGLFLYLNTSPFLFQGGFGRSAAEYGWLFAINSLISWAGVQVGARLPLYFPAQWLLVGYGTLGLGVGIALVLTDGSGWLVAAALFGAQLFAFGATLTSMQTLALLNHGSEAGTAASLLGVSNFTVTTLISPIFALLGTASTGQIGVMLAILYGVGITSLLFVVQPWRVPDLRKSGGAAH